MPKQGLTAREKMQLYVKDFGSDFFTPDGKVLTCKVCEQDVNAKKRDYVQQHINTDRHKKRLRREGGSNQSIRLLTNFLEPSSKESAFNLDLCQMLVECNIPLFKIQHPSLRNFLKKYTKQDAPDHTTLRKNYLAKLYEATLLKIRTAVGENRIWISVDETIDGKGQYVVNTVIGCLKSDKPSTAFLIGSEIVERSNHATIAQSFVNSLRLLWPEEIHHDRVLLFVSDAAPYMKKAAEGLKVLFPKMIHVTCLAHGIHRVCEEVRILFPDVDGLVANVKKVFLKSPSRVRIFQATVPNLALPPEPVVTRWGTWISAALYYAENLEEIERVFSELNEADAAAIKKSKDLLLEPALKAHLTFIAATFSAVPALIQKLECTTQSLEATLGILADVKGTIDAALGSPLMANKSETSCRKYSSKIQVWRSSLRFNKVFKATLLPRASRT